GIRRLALALAPAYARAAEPKTSSTVWARRSGSARASQTPACSPSSRQRLGHRSAAARLVAYAAPQRGRGSQPSRAARGRRRVRAVARPRALVGLASRTSSFCASELMRWTPQLPAACRRSQAAKASACSACVPLGEGGAAGLDGRLEPPESDSARTSAVTAAATTARPAKTQRPGATAGERPQLE